jgi:ribosome modulation factor
VLNRALSDRGERISAVGYDWSKLVNEGAEAGLDGLSADCCPYEHGTPERELWLGGWHCAMDGVHEDREGAETPIAPRMAAE